MHFGLALMEAASFFARRQREKDTADSWTEFQDSTPKFLLLNRPLRRIQKNAIFVPSNLKQFYESIHISGPGRAVHGHGQRTL